MNGHSSDEPNESNCMGNAITSRLDYLQGKNEIVFMINDFDKFQELIFTCSMLYSEMAIKQTFGGRSQKITPEFISATKLKILAENDSHLND